MSNVLIFSNKVDESFEVKDVDVGDLPAKLRFQVTSILAASPTVNITVTKIDCCTVEQYREFFLQVPETYIRMAPSYGYPMCEKKKMLEAYFATSTTVILDFTLGDCNVGFDRN